MSKRKHYDPSPAVGKIVLDRLLSSIMTAFLDFAVMLCICLTALINYAAGQTRTQPIDIPSIEIKARATPAGTSGRALIMFTVTVIEPIPDAVLEIVSAGGVRLELPTAFQLLPPEEPYHSRMSHNQRLKRTLGNLRPGVPLTVRLYGIITDNDRGFVAAAVRSDRDPAFDESLSLYLGRVGPRLISSNSSLLDVDAGMMRVRATALATGNSALLRQIEALYQSGASSIFSRSEQSKDPALLAGRIMVTGRLLFTDRAGATHPVKAATVQTYDRDPSGNVQLASVLTDDDGRFRVEVSNEDGDGTGQDIFILASAEGPNVRVRQWATNTVWSIRSEGIQQDVRDGETVDIQLTAANTQSNNVAFEIHQANEQMARYIAQLQGRPLPQLTVRYPKAGDSSSYNGTMLLADTDAHDWDNIQHEYGHHVQRHARIGNNPGGGHGSNQDLCSRYGNKTKGINLAYGEAWPTVFSLISQHEQGLATLSIPNLGDTRYTDVKGDGRPSGYDLETGAAANGGEGRELSMMRVIWDFYDPVDRTDIVMLGAEPLWRASTDGGRAPFSAFWTALIRSRPEIERTTLGVIMASQRLSAAPSAPADGITYSGGAPPTFRWDAASGCRTTSGLRYSLILIDQASGEIRLRSPFQASRSFTPDATQRTRMFAGPNGPLTWTVLTRDQNAPVTGDYYSSGRTLIDAFQP
jgi:hypothetical protein